MIGDAENLAKDMRSSQEANPTIRILLIEDHELNRQLLGDYLGYLGYRVLSLPGGAHFFQAIADFQPHLILLDLKLPDIDGFTLLEQIQTRQDWVHIPVIVVSALAFKVDEQRSLNLGARRFFIKPTNLDRLHQAIQEELSYLST